MILHTNKHHEGFIIGGFIGQEGKRELYYEKETSLGRKVALVIY